MTPREWVERMSAVAELADGASAPGYPPVMVELPADKLVRVFAALEAAVEWREAKLALQAANDAIETYNDDKAHREHDEAWRRIHSAELTLRVAVDALPGEEADDG